MTETNQETTPEAETPSEQPTETKPEEKGPLKVGDTTNGKVTNIANFGAFVQLENGKDGLVHISEIANEFVKDINQFVEVGQEVDVQITGINKQGKFELSIKKALKEEPKEPAMFLHKKSQNEDFEDKMNSYLKRSEEKQIDIRRNLKKKQGITKRKK